MIIPVMCSVKKTYTITVKSSDVGKLTVYPIYKEFYRDLEQVDPDNLVQGELKSEVSLAGEKEMHLESVNPISAGL